MPGCEPSSRRFDSGRTPYALEALTVMRRFRKPEKTARARPLALSFVDSEDFARMA